MPARNGSWVILKILDSRLKGILISLAVFIALGMISSAVALSPARSYIKLLPFIVGAYCFYTITEGKLTNHRLLKLVKIALGIVFAMSLLGNLQYVYFLKAGVTGIDLRITSVTTHPNALAKFLLVFIPASITLAVMSKSGKSTIMYSLISISLVACEVFTLSRGAWVAVVLAGLLLVIMFRNYFVLAIMALLAMTAVFLLPADIGAQRVYSIFNITHAWNIERLNVWIASWQMFQDHPLLGVGLNNFQYYYSAYKPEAGVEVFRHAHNTFLNIAVEMGLPALLCFISFVGLVVKRNFHSASAEYENAVGKSIVIGTISLLVYGMVEYNFNNELQIILFFAMLGIAVQLTRPKSCKAAEK